MQTISVTTPAAIAPVDAHAPRAEDEDAGILAFGQELALMMMPDAAKPDAPDTVSGDATAAATETAGLLDSAQLVDSLITPGTVFPDGDVLADATTLAQAGAIADATTLAQAGAIADTTLFAGVNARAGGVLPTGAPTGVTDVARDAAVVAFATPLATQASGARVVQPRLAAAPAAETLPGSAETVDVRGFRETRDPRAPFAVREADGRGLRRASSASGEAPTEALLAPVGSQLSSSAETALSSADAVSPLDTLSPAALASRWTPAARAAEAASAPATARVDTPFGTDGWKDTFQQKIVWLVDRQQQSAELHLNPPNLGPVEVVLDMSDNRANIIFVSPHAAVRDAIEASLAELRAALSDRGLAMGEALVSADAGSAREQFQREAAHAARGAPAALPGDLPGDIPGPRTTLLGLVDTFA